MADRNEYMRLYMQRRRAAQRAGRLVETVHSVPAPAGAPEAPSTTEPGQLQEIAAGPGLYARYKWAWWLLAGVIIGACLHAVINPAPAGAGANQPPYHVPLLDESTWPVNTEPGAADTTGTNDDRAADETTEEPGQE